MISPDQLRAAGDTLFNDTVRVRRHLHRNPELSFREERTASFICEELDSAGIPYEAGIGGHGVVATIEGAVDEQRGRVIALRADIDALPIDELNDASYRSAKPGVMHACGHDAHTASLLTAGRILHQVRPELPGVFKLIFQPAEEKAPGGAVQMIRDGVLENPGVQSVIGQHVNPEIPAGKVGFRSGLFMGSVDDLYITIRGKGGHAAKPHLCIDPVAVAASLITTLQQVVSRNADPTHPTVLTFGYINGAGSNNIIPDTVEIAGTMRTFDPLWRDTAVERIRTTTREHVASLGARAEIRMERGYPSLSNDPAVTARARDRAAAFLGEENVVELPPALWGEDFAYYALERPACFYNLGVRNESRGIVNPVHSPGFDVDEEALAIGPPLMAWIALGELTADAPD